MGEYDVFLAGEEHHEHEYRLAGIRLVKRLSEQKRISCLSMELPFNEYQHILDGFTPGGYGPELGDYTSLVHIAKKRGLDVIASDYRDSFAGHVIRSLRELDLRSDAPDKAKERLFLEYLKPLCFAPGQVAGKGIYAGFSDDICSASDLFDFLAFAYSAERELFAANSIDSYLRRVEGSSILHIAGVDHVKGICAKLESKGRRVGVIDMLAGVD
jgi:hypothetical protein